MLDEKGHTVHLTDRGVDASRARPITTSSCCRTSRPRCTASSTITTLAAAEKLEARRAVEIEYARKSETLHIVHQLLRAHALYEKDVNYVVQEGQVLIVDEFTGRTMPGRRWSEGLHQAVEAKERVQVKGETQTLATITIQNYFRLYEKLAGMTGTAETEEGEFHEIYGLDVAVIPTNRPIVARRPAGPHLQDAPREVQRDRRGDAPPARARAAGARRHDERRGARRRSRACSARAGIKHNVLNAKYHQREAEIVAGAGQPGAITIATNMAGRGTDIKLGAGVTESRPSVRQGPGRQGGRRRGERRAAHHRLGAPRERGASTGSCAAARAVRAIRARRSSSSRSKTT